MPLCHLLQQHGAATHRLPALEIKSAGHDQELAALVGRLEDFDLIIFTSANAVRFGARLLGEKRDLTLAAIGPATTRALHSAGYHAAVQPSVGFDSEGLLEQPALQRLSGRRILIIKGGDGRQLLQQELTRRGAQVICADVYTRAPAKPRAGELQVVTATSVDIADALLVMASAPLRQAFERAHWLVPSRRVATALHERGLKAPVLQANSAEDQDLVDALLRWRGSASEA
jgi:uroporphyrinogen-III synthase